MSSLLHAGHISISITLFLFAAGLIGYFGIRMTYLARDIAMATGLGEAFTGAVFIGATTSLSGIIASATAAWHGEASLAVSNSLGGIAAQTLFLVLEGLMPFLSPGAFKRNMAQILGLPDRVLRTIGLDAVLAGAAGATIILASIRALGEQNLKRRLAYSTVSQLSYIVLGAAIGTSAALAGAMFHIVAHGFMKITLFFCAGAIYIKTHNLEIPDMAGLGRQMPITFGAFTLGALGLAGTPLFVGFVSKWNLGLGALQAGQWIFLAVLLTSGLLNFAYFFPIVYGAFFGKPGQSIQMNEAPSTLWVPLAITAVISVILGLYPNAGWDFFALAWKAAESVMAGAPSMLAGGTR